jgi:hypothetical protein
MMHGQIHHFEGLPQVDDAPVANLRGWTGAPVRSRPLLGVIRNLRSHRNKRRELTQHDSDDVIVACPQKRGELSAILADFAVRGVDYIVVDGGDGTVRDVLTCGAGIYGESWPGMVVIPSGKTNALAFDLGVPAGWTLADGLAAARRGNVVRRQPLVVAQQGNARAQVQGFVLGGGAFTRAISLGQKSHRLGAFNTAVVGLTALWSAGQALLGSAGNVWRRGTKMRVKVDGQELPHLGGLPADERFVLFASSLRRFPAGLDPFRGVSEPLRMGVIDNPSRGLLLRLGAIFRGTASEATKARGMHVFGAEAVEWDVSESFILDGESFPAGHYRVSAGPALRFVVP